MAQIDFDDPYAGGPAQGVLSQPAKPNAEPYTNWNDERAWAMPALQQHVQSKPFLYGKVGQKELDDAFNIFNSLRPSLPNRGDAFNQTLDQMGWWTGQNTYNPPAQQQAPKVIGKGPSGGNYQEWFRSLVAGQPARPETLAGIESELGQYGIKVLRNAKGIPGKIQLPDGSIIDVGMKFSSGDPSQMSWGWLTGSGGGAAGVGPTSYTDPNTLRFEQQILARLAELAKPVKRPDDDRYRAAALARADELTKQPPYTAAEEQALITRMQQPLTQARDTRQDFMKEVMGGRNIAPSSGVFLDQVYNTPNRDYERALAGGTNDLAVRAIDERQSRKDDALSILANLVGLGKDQRNETEGRSREALTTGAILPQLDERRLALLMQTMGYGGTDTGGVMNTLTNIMGQNQQQSQFNAGQSRNDAAMLGQVLGYLVNSPLLGGGR